MAIVYKLLEEMVNELGGGTVMKHDTIVPKTYTYPVSGSVKKMMDRKGRSKEFNWITAYQCEVSDFLEEKQFPIQRERIIDFEFFAALDRALENAYNHGYDSDPNGPIEILCYGCKEGLVWVVTDKGKGFNPKETHDKLKENENYFENGGLGYMVFDGIDDEVSIISEGGKGTHVIIKMPYDKTIGVERW